MTAAAAPQAIDASALDAATQIIAEVRGRCAALGLSPRQFAELLLPEALLAMMISGMRQEEVEAAFARFARDEISAWFLQVKRTAGYCDCEREARGGHGDDCLLHHAAHLPMTQRILDEARHEAGG